MYFAPPHTVNWIRMGVLYTYGASKASDHTWEERDEKILKKHDSTYLI